MYFIMFVRISLEASKNMYSSSSKPLPILALLVEPSVSMLHKCSTDLSVAATKKYAAMMSRQAIETGFEAVVNNGKL
jgi:hypothetical protein